MEHGVHREVARRFRSSSTVRAKVLKRGIRAVLSSLGVALRGAATRRCGARRVSREGAAAQAGR